MATILIADDHPLFRQALQAAVRQALGECEIAQAEDVDGLFKMIDSHRQADLLLLDLNMPGAQGFSALVQVRGMQPSLPVVVVSGREDGQTVRRALAHGAAGFIPKSADPDTLAQALQSVMDGDIWSPQGDQPGGLDPAEADLARRLAELTPQQFRVLGMVCTGLLNKQVAYELSVSEATIKAHMTAILRKLGVNTRTQVVMLANQLQLDAGAGS